MSFDLSDYTKTGGSVMTTKHFIRKTLLTAITVFFLLIAGVVPALPAEAPAPAEEHPTVDFSVSPLTRYVWRGQEMTKDSIVIQPSMTVGYKGFTANLWGNLDTAPYAPAGTSYSSAWTETDLTLAYNKTIGPVTAGLGYIYYGLAPAHTGAPDPPDSQEVFATLTLNKLLSPTLTVYREIDRYHQWYFLLGISHAIEFNKTVSLKLAASASYLLSDDAAMYPKYNKQAIATKDKYSNFHDGVITASLPVAVAKYITVTPTVSYVFPLCDDAKYEMQARSQKVSWGGATPSDGDSSYLYGGMTLSFTY
jgi:hypothetical protein